MNNHASARFALTCVGHDRRVRSVRIFPTLDRAREQLARAFLDEKEAAYESGYDEDHVSETVSADYAALRYGPRTEYHWEITKISLQ